MHNHEHQGGCDDEHDHCKDDHKISAHRGESSYGWVWIVGIIVVVAVALFFLQSNVPQDADVVEGDEVADEVSVDPLRARPLGVYDLSAPTSVDPGSFVSVGWVVSTEGEDVKITSTSIQWDTVSLSDREFGLETGTEDAYTNAAEEYPAGEYSIPAVFETNLKAPESGAIYFRAVANVDGMNYWSEEQSVLVKSK